MTQTEINKLHKSIATDFKIIAIKTELWDISYCHQILHDVKQFMMFGYLESVSMIMVNHSNTPVKVKKYLSSSENSRNDRPGGVDWDDGEGAGLVVIITQSSNYCDLSEADKLIFQRDYLKSPWSPSTIDTNFTHLTPSLSKKYAHGNSGIDRIDFN